jgi:hypothetical protein
VQVLTGGPREGLPEAELRDALAFRHGGRVRHGCDVLDLSDRNTSRSLRFEGRGSSVTWAYRPPDRMGGQVTSVAEVRRRATLVVPGTLTENLNAVRLQLWTELQLRAGRWARFHLGVFEVLNPGAVADDGQVLRRSLALADKSHRWANSQLVDPVHVPAGTVAVEWVKARLTEVFGETRFAIATSTATLDQPRTLEAGLSWLEALSRVLEAVAFDQLTVTEDGLPAAQPLATLSGRGVEQIYGAGHGKVLTAGQVDPLWPSLPNVVRFIARQGPSLGNVEGNGRRTVRNQTTGPASITARQGREVELRVEVDADDQPTLDAIAEAEAQRYFAGGGQRWTGRVALNPRHSDRDVIELKLPRLGLDDGSWLVTEWNLPLGPMTSPDDALMTITAERRV